MSPGPEEVVSITKIGDPVTRNVRITKCYSRLSAAMAERTGACANWCTFATWASRQAGATIRAEDLLDRLEKATRTGSVVVHPIRAIWRALLRRGVFYPKTRLGRIVRNVHTPFDAFERASDAVARGNVKVFAEIGLEFARYLQASDPQSFIETLRPGDPPEGQALLRQAFGLYERQRSERDAAARAQLIYHANLLIGLHEQTRLQPEIREAMEAGPRTVRAALRGPLIIFEPLAAAYSRYVRDVTCRIITDSLMVLRLPGPIDLALGEHLDRPPAPDLRDLRDPELRALAERYAADDCGATDWSDLTQRMRYISVLFRAFHEEPALHHPATSL